MKIINILVFLLLVSTVSAEKFKIENTIVTIDEGLETKEILDFVDTFDLNEINAIYFLKYENLRYNSMLWYWGNYQTYQIHVFNMETIDWRHSFKQVYDYK